MSGGEWFRGFFDQAYVDSLAAQVPASRTRREVREVVRRLGLVRGARILDVPCGFGRHAHELARLGFDVVGIDLSPAMIAEARRRLRRGTHVEFHHADMRRLAYAHEFDALICMFTGFGYFGRRGDAAMLKRMARALKPGGKILIDHRDPVHDARRADGREWWRVGRDLYVLEERSFNRRASRLEVEWHLVRQGDKRSRRKTARLDEYSLPEWRRLFAAAGLRLTGAYADLDGSRYRPGAGPRLVLVGESAA